MPESLCIKLARIRIVEFHEIQGREVAGRVVQKHVLRAWIGCPDLPVGDTGVPFIDGGVELNSGIGALPRGKGNPVP